MIFFFFTIDLFKQQIEGIRSQYQFNVETALSNNVDEFQVGKNENDDSWKILKYYSNVIQIQRQKRNSIIKKKHIENMNDESGRVDKILFILLHKHF